MQSLAVLLLCFAACQAGQVLLAAPGLVRAPAHDSAIIRSDRLGGNFAYSVHEGHAYAAVSPVVQHVQTPVAVSYHAPAVAYHAPAVAYHAPLAAPAPVVLEAPKLEIKTVETPAEVKTLPLTYALPHAYPYTAYSPYAPYTIVKTAEKSE